MKKHFILHIVVLLGINAYVLLHLQACKASQIFWEIHEFEVSFVLSLKSINSLIWFFRLKTNFNNYFLLFFSCLGNGIFHMIFKWVWKWKCLSYYTQWWNQDCLNIWEGLLVFFSILVVLTGNLKSFFMFCIVLKLFTALGQVNLLLLENSLIQFFCSIKICELF